jgi:PAS domain S-box-containing protein
MYATALSATIAVSVLLYRKGIKPMVAFLRNYTSTVYKINAIFEEITPNGGTSIKDKIDRIDRQVTLVNERQKASSADFPDALFETDPEGNCYWINRTYARMVKRLPSELMGRGWQNAIAQEDREEVVEAWYSAAKDDREFVMDFKFETPDGELIPAKVRSYKMTDSKGETIGFYGNIQKL